ncbi:Hypothetical protein HDN1F_24990 [gamma proteobacterium HdN1]|nr:Hypothetical protein HDN1F_24990 [gamma proteobacterium HdN1]
MIDGTRPSASPIKTTSLFKDRIIMKKTLRGAIILTAGFAVAACVKQAWQVTYPGPENYSTGSSVLVAENGTSYMAGVIDAQTIFVAAYNANGQKLWDRKISGSGFSARSLGHALSLDNGTLYLSWDKALFMGVTLFKLNAATGEVLLQRDLENSALTLGSNVQLGEDHQIYLNYALDLFQTSSHVVAYSADGEFLWQHNLNTYTQPQENNLQQYQPRAAAMGENSSSGEYAGLNQNSPVVQGGFVFLYTGDTITALDSQGNVVVSQSAANLGLNSIARLIAHGNKLLALGSTGNTINSVVLDLNLTELSHNTLSTESVEVGQSDSKKGNACIMLVGSAYQLTELDANGAPLWTRTIENSDSSTIEREEVLADQAACYYSTTTSKDGRITTQADRYNGPGEATDHFSLPDLLTTGIVVQGKSIYHVGMTSSYNEETQQYDDPITTAVLDKKSHK